MSHTPGPWNASGPTGSVMQSYSQPWAVVSYPAMLVCGCFGDTPGGDAAAEANARLIAAAPELLASAKECEAILARMDTLRHIEPQFPALDNLRAAIAKAEGK